MTKRSCDQPSAQLPTAAVEEGDTRRMRMRTRRRGDLVPVLERLQPRQLKDVVRNLSTPVSKQNTTTRTKCKEVLRRKVSDSLSKRRQPVRIHSVCVEGEMGECGDVNVDGDCCECVDGRQGVEEERGEMGGEEGGKGEEGRRRRRRERVSGEVGKEQEGTKRCVQGARGGEGKGEKGSKRGYNRGGTKRCGLGEVGGEGRCEARTSGEEGREESVNPLVPPVPKLRRTHATRCVATAIHVDVTVYTCSDSTGDTPTVDTPNDTSIALVGTPDKDNTPADRDDTPDDTPEDSEYPQPSTNYQKMQRQLARQKQLADMHAREAAYAREERYLRRHGLSKSTKKTNSRRRVLWKDEAGLVEVFTYSPSSSLSRGSTLEPDESLDN